MYTAKSEIENNPTMHTNNVIEMWKWRGYIIPGDEIVIPHVDVRKPVSFYMLPLEDIDDKYKINEYLVKDIVACATTPRHYNRLVTALFFGHIKKFNPVFKPNVKSKTYPNDLKLALERYIVGIFQSTDARFDHQLAYAVYVMDTVCSSCEWSDRNY